ncbi:MAG: hypothetical protein GX851_03590 [Clostridiales bacterium]|nr:hypothetical protein [Clostridiales bacterium]
MTQYTFPILRAKGETSALSEYRLESFHWEAAEPYRPAVFFSVFAVNGNGIYCRARVYEESPRTVCTERDEPVYEDSCLEFFLAPVDGRNEYLNIECNSGGVFLSQFGASREGRVFVKELTAEAPAVTPFSGSDTEGSFWGVEICVPEPLIGALYGIDFSAEPAPVRFNVFKCGDRTSIPHYLAFSPVTAMPPGFHNPECFARAHLRFL